MLKCACAQLSFISSFPQYWRKLHHPACDFSSLHWMKLPIPAAPHVGCVFPPSSAAQLWVYYNLLIPRRACTLESTSRFKSAFHHLLAMRSFNFNMCKMRMGKEVSFWGKSETGIEVRAWDDNHLYSKTRLQIYLEWSIHCFSVCLSAFNKPPFLCLAYSLSPFCKHV